MSATVNPDARRQARVAIVQAANRHAVNVNAWGTVSAARAPYTLKQLHRAVFACRQHGLVKDSVLIAAGFRTRNGGPRTTATGRP